MKHQSNLRHAEGRFKMHIRSIRKEEARWFQYNCYEIDGKGNLTLFFKSSQNSLSFQCGAGWVNDPENFYLPFTETYNFFKQIKYELLDKIEAEFRAAGLTDEQLKLVL